MDRYLKDFEVESKNPSEENIRRWRKAVWLVKNRRRRFRFVADLDKRDEAEKKKLQIQEKIPPYVQKAALQFKEPTWTNFLKDFEVESKNPSEETIQRWRKAVSLVKNPRRRFRSVANLAKRNEAEKKKRQIQEKIRVAPNIQKAGLQLRRNLFETTGAAAPKYGNSECLKVPPQQASREREHSQKDGKHGGSVVNNIISGNTIYAMNSTKVGILLSDSEVKEILNEVKEIRNEVNEVKEILNEVKEIRNEVKEVKEIQNEVKEMLKEVKEMLNGVKEIRNEVKEVKEIQNEVKEIQNEVKEIG